MDKIIAGVDGVYIAGGFINRIVARENLDDGDIDVFFRSKSSMSEWDEKFFNDLNDEQISKYSGLIKENKYGPFTIQRVARNFYTPEELLFDFDFTCSQYVYTNKTYDKTDRWSVSDDVKHLFITVDRKMYYHPTSIEDSISKSPKFTTTETKSVYPLSEMKRILE